MNNIDKQYQALLQDILDNGIKKTDRTGTGTLSVFGRQIRHKMSEGFPLLTTKKMAWKTMVTELLWFLRGDTNIKYLVDNGCHIWDGDAYKAYLKWFENTSKKFEVVREPWTKEQYIEQIKLGNVDSDLSDLGPIYGKQWRDCGGYEYESMATATHDNITYKTYHKKGVDQIQNLINELKTNPDSRRLMVSAWNVGEIDQMVLPPCHYGFQVYTRELSLKERCDAYIKWSNDPKCIQWKKHIENEMGWDYEKPEWVFDEVREQLDKSQFPTRAISLMWNQRSVDTFLGLPFNIASYGLLLEIIAKEVNMVPDELIGNLGDVHLYLNHIEQAKEQMTRTPYDLPKIILDYRNGEYNKELKDFTPDDFILNNYQSHPTIKAPLSN